MKKEFNNTCFQLVREYVKQNMGYGPEIDNTESGKLYQKCMDEMKEFDGKKVEISYTFEDDWIKMVNTNTTKKGKIVVINGFMYFFEGKRTRMGNQIDAGLLLGFKNIIVPLKIVEL